ncbi:MAG: flavodoxin domain-containing protein [Clostridium sp.]|uniref:flavodoxin domain-containing protein n=1 Tax=Clostridium sp. TaxID=1506 RepID=UPI003EE4DBD9
MNTLVLYYSKNGTTQMTVDKMKKKTNSEYEYINLKNKSDISIDKYTRIFIGCGIYVGTIEKQVRNFLDLNSSLLKNKEVIFFIHGLASENNYKDVIKASIKDGSLVDGCKVFYLGGQLDIKKQNFLVKQMLKVIAKKKRLDINNMRNLDEKTIEEFIKTLK